MKVLVTGASGRFAPYVARELMANGHEVVLTSRRPPAEEFADVPYVKADLACWEEISQAVKGVDAIQHIGAMAWPSDHPNSRESAKERGVPFDATFKANMLGPYYLMEAAVAEGVKTVVMAGSNCALGVGDRISGRPLPVHYLPIDEEHPCYPEDSYCWTKFAGEKLLEYYSNAYGIRTHVTRLAGICQAERRQSMADSAGPTGSWNSWWCSWVASEDAAVAHRLLMDQAEDLPVHGVYFLNADDTGHVEPSRELIEKFKPELAQMADGLEGHQAFLSNEKLKKAVGWEHELTWRDLA